MIAWRVLAAVAAAGLVWACGGDGDDGGKGGTGGVGGSGAVGGSGGSGGTGGEGAAGGSGGTGGEGATGGSGGSGGDGGSGGSGGDEGLPPETGTPDPFPHVACTAPRPTESPYTSTPDVIGAPGSRFVAGGADSKGNSYYVTALGRVFWRKPDGTFTSLGQFGDGASPVRGVFVNRDVAWVYAGNTFSAGWLVKIVEGETEQHLPNKSVDGIFRDADGRTIAKMCTDRYECGYFLLGEDFSTEELTNADPSLGECEVLKPLAHHGVAERCWSGGEQYFTVGSDQTQLAYAAAGERVDMARVHGRSPIDIWSFEVTGEGNKLSHWDGDDWVTENVSGMTGGGIFALSPIEAMIVTDSMLWHFDGTCWQQILPDGVPVPVFGHESAGPVLLGNKRVGWLNGTTFTEVTLP